MLHSQSEKVDYILYNLWNVQIKTTNTSKVHSIVANIIESYNKLYNWSISYEVEDLVDENGVGIGTEVRVEV